VPRFLFFWALAAAALFLPLFTLGSDFLFGFKDKVFYTTILDLYGVAVRNGEFYPRWLAEANGGQGTSAMIFYAPLAYFLTTILFEWLAPLDPLVHLRFILGMGMSQFIAGILCYIWLKRHFEKRVAFIGSLLYVLFPYKFFYVWFHHNLAQLWALAWLPLWMIAAEYMCEKHRNAVVFYGVAIGLVCYTHPLTLMVFAPIPALYVLLFSSSPRGKTIISLAVAHGLGLGISAAYLLPMIVNRPFIYADSYISGFYQVTNNLLHPDTLFCLYYLIIIGLVFLLSRLCHDTKTRQARLFYFFSALVFLYWFMTTPLSRPLWETIPLLAYIQYPMMRLHSVILLCSTWVAAYGLTLWLAYRNKLPKIDAAVFSPYAALLSMLVTAWFIHAFLTTAILDTETGKQKIIPPKFQKSMHEVYAITPLEYITRWGNTQSLEEVQARSRQPLVSVVRGNGEVELTVQDKRLLTFTAHTKSEAMIVRIKQWYFPGWEARDENGQAYPLSADMDGLIRVTVSRGDHALQVKLPWLLGEKAGMLLSLMTIAGMGVWFLRSCTSKMPIK
jgi:hypothetical protein